MKYRCVQCDFEMQSLFVQYSPGNIRLMKCENCKAVADEYIECEIMIVVIDLILHKPKAYRHLLYNVLVPQSSKFHGLVWKCSLLFLLLDAYRSLFMCRSKAEWGVFTNIDSLMWTSQKVFADVVFGNIAFIFTFLLVGSIFLDTSTRAFRYIDILLAILVSSYFKVFLFAMMVWEFPSSTVFIIDLYVLSSNIVALKVFFLGEPVITQSAMSRCVITCFSSHLMKFMVTKVLR